MWLPTHLDNNSPCILQTESQPINYFFETESYLLSYDDQLSLTHLTAQSEAVECFFSDFALISP